MPSLVLGPLLRYVARDCATIWVQTDQPCEVEILGFRERTWSVEGLHFALLEITGLEPGGSVEYEVALDGSTVWPEDRSLPASLIATVPDDGPITVAFGSCRITRKHEPPYVLRSHEHPAGHGIDALRAYALRAAAGGPVPTTLLLLGDQIYADQPSPELKRELAARGRHSRAPEDVLGDFGEYALAYREAWSDPALRWLMATVPTAMVFDDHEIHNEWRISQTWMRRMTSNDWFDDHICAGLMAYWVFQHLGNLSPDELARSDLYRRVREADDGGAILAREMADAGHQIGHSRWSHARWLGDARLVVIDSRAGREVTPRQRELISEEEWSWVSDQASQPARHLLLASSVPFLLAPGLHHIEAWDEAVSDGAWGRVMAQICERLRLLAVMDHWASFQRTFRKLARFVDDTAHGRHGDAPTSILMLSGDVHHCYVAEVGFPRDDDEGRPRSAVWQIVCSAFRKELAPHEKVVIGFGHSRVAERLARRLARAAGVEPVPFDWRITEEPDFENQIATLRLDGDAVFALIEAVVPGSWSEPELQTAFDGRLVEPSDPIAGRRTRMP